jgi:hypothetical protein
MRCQTARILIMKRLSEPLPARQSDALAAHLEVCGACRAEQAAGERFEASLRPLRPTPAPCSGTLPPGLAGALRARQERHSMFDRRTLALAGLAAASVAAAALALRPPGRHRVPSPLPRQENIAHGPLPRSLPPHPPVTPSRPAMKGQPTPQRGDSLRRTWHTPRTPSGTPAPGYLPGKRPSGQQPVPRPAGDAEFLDGSDAQLAQIWTSGLHGDDPLRGKSNRRSRVREDFGPLPLPRTPLRDDFILIRFPMLAGADPAAVREAIKRQQQEASIVDPRLFRRVTLQRKGVALEDLCRELGKQADVLLQASRGVGDEKATVFVKERPAREVMRAIARLFGYRWARSGEEGHYRYELVQELKSQLEEEELRSRDFHAALLQLDREMDAYRPYLDQSPDQLKARMEGAGPAERQRLGNLVHGGWGGMQLYNRLSPAERSALAGGEPLQFSEGAAQPDRSLPAEWRGSLLQLWGDLAFAQQGSDAVGGQAADLRARGLNPLRIADDPSASSTIRLKISRSELGQLSLETETMVSVKHEKSEPGLGARDVLATAESPSVSNPENAKLNEKLRDDPAFKQEVSWKPEPGCPHLDDAEVPPSGLFPGYVDVDEWEAIVKPHVNSAEVWEAVHKATGLPIVADYYTRLYPVPPVTVTRRSLFDGLCQAGDALGARWTKDGDFLLARSTSYFWDKLKEVPNRFLERWLADRARAGGLPADDLLEMAALSDQQLDSTRVRQGIRHCWGLPEWRLLSREWMGSDPIRPYARLVAALPQAQRERALGAEGLAFADLNAAQQGEVLRLIRGRIVGPPGEVLQGLLQTRLRLDYVPAGRYIWVPVVERSANSKAARLPVVAGPTAAEALAVARKIEPQASPQQIRLRPTGLLAVTLLWPNGNSFSLGNRPITYR